jgi:hypothetical protein
MEGDSTHDERMILIDAFFNGMEIDSFIPNFYDCKGVIESNTESYQYIKAGLNDPDMSKWDKIDNFTETISYTGQMMIDCYDTYQETDDWVNAEI